MDASPPTQDYDVTCSFFGDGTCNVGQFYEVRACVCDGAVG